MNEFERIERLPNYIFAVVNDLKMQARRAGEDVIDFSMGNPDGPTPKPIVDKLIEAASKPKNHRYSVSKGIYKLREAICNWYARRYNVSLNPETEAVVTMGSKEGYVHLTQAITNVGDVAIVPDPTYPIHSYAFMLAGASVRKVELKYNKNFQAFSLEEILKNHINLAKVISTEIILDDFREYLEVGYYPFYFESKDDYHIKLTNTINTVIESDIPSIFSIELAVC